MDTTHGIHMNITVDRSICRNIDINTDISTIIHLTCICTHK